MTRRRFRALALAAAWTCIAGAAAETHDSPLLALKRGGEVACRSPEPFFCENVHVRCAGRTAVRTFPFVLRSTGGWVALVTEAPEFQRQYENADVEWDGDATYVLLQPKGAPGYLKLLADGKYVFRHYIGSRGVMSLGACR